MLRFIAKQHAKIQYRWRQESEAETNMLHSRLASSLGAEKRRLAAKITSEADEMDARIKHFTELEENGYWLCDDGHESESVPNGNVDVLTQKCSCGAPAKFIKRDLMTGQEKYESDKERGEAEKIATEKRQQAQLETDNAANSEQAAKYFENLATTNRNVADRLRKL